LGKVEVTRLATRLKNRFLVSLWWRIYRKEGRNPYKFCSTLCRRLPVGHPRREGSDGAGTREPGRATGRDHSRRGCGDGRGWSASSPITIALMKSEQAYTLPSNEEVNNLSLLEEQRWRIYYDPESLRAIRDRADLDRFRAPRYFGDVSVIPFSKDRGTLLNEPCSDFGGT